jgi:hypothetical protein
MLIGRGPAWAPPICTSPLSLGRGVRRATSSGRAGTAIRCELHSMSHAAGGLSAPAACLSFLCAPVRPAHWWGMQGTRRRSATYITGGASRETATRRCCGVSQAIFGMPPPPPMPPTPACHSMVARTGWAAWSTQTAWTTRGRLGMHEGAGRCADPSGAQVPGRARHVRPLGFMLARSLPGSKHGHRSTKHAANRRTVRSGRP